VGGEEEPKAKGELLPSTFEATKIPWEFFLGKAKGWRKSFIRQETAREQVIREES